MSVYSKAAWTMDRKEKGGSLIYSPQNKWALVIPDDKYRSGWPDTVRGNPLADMYIHYVVHVTYTHISIVSFTVYYVHNYVSMISPPVSAVPEFKKIIWPT